MDISSNLAMAVSAAVAIIYTLMGGLYSVAYTDVIQLTLVFFGLVQKQNPFRFTYLWTHCLCVSVVLRTGLSKLTPSSRFLTLQWFCVPFILTSPASANITVAAVTELYQEPWIGKLETEDVGRWLDELLLLVKG